MKSNTTCLPRVVSIAISKSEYRTPCGIIHIADRQSHKGPSAYVLHVRRDCAVHADVAAIRHRWGWLSSSDDAGAVVVIGRGWVGVLDFRRHRCWVVVRLWGSLHSSILVAHDDVGVLRWSSVRLKKIPHSSVICM